MCASHTFWLCHRNNALCFASQPACQPASHRHHLRHRHRQRCRCCHQPACNQLDWMFLHILFHPLSLSSFLSFSLSFSPYCLYIVLYLLSIMWRQHIRSSHTAATHLCGWAFGIVSNSGAICNMGDTGTVERFSFNFFSFISSFFCRFVSFHFVSTRLAAAADFFRNSFHSGMSCLFSAVLPSNWIASLLWLALNHWI